MASYSVGFPSGSPPPVRAATSMFLISLANSLPRFASMTAFLCLVVAHFECPLTRLLVPRRRADVLCSTARSRARSRGIPHHLAEVLMDAPVAGQFGVERRGQQAALT